MASSSSSSDDEGSDADVGAGAKSDVDGVFTLINSVNVLNENVAKKLDKYIKDSLFARFNDNTEFVKDFRLLNATVIHMMSVANNRLSQLKRKVERLESIIEEKNNELEKMEETHAMILNDLERSCRVHREDKKLLLPLAFKTVKYSEPMATFVGGDSKCSTCLMDFSTESQLAELSCGHFFHKDCAIKWMTESKSACSLCNTHVTGKSSFLVKRRRTSPSPVEPAPAQPTPTHTHTQAAEASEFDFNEAA
jgi:hypothetical protein